MQNEWTQLEVVRMIEYTMRVALCDDEPEMLESIAAMTREAAALENIRCEVTPYASSMALLEAIQRGAQYHALLLDVMMDEMTGMELAAVLRAQQNGAAIVFISSNREMAVYGYEVSALRYLVKPLELPRLREALRLCYQAGMREQEIVLSTARGSRRVVVDDILYAETWGRGVRLTLTDGQEECLMRISELENMLPDSQFTMCHRTILVNLACVKYLRHCELELKTGGTLPVSKYRQHAVREKLFSYLED